MAPLLKRSTPSSALVAGAGVLLGLLSPPPLPSSPSNPASATFVVAESPSSPERRAQQQPPLLPETKVLSTTYASPQSDMQSAAGFMFDVKTKTNVPGVAVIGLDVNVVHRSVFGGGDEARVVVYTKEGSYEGHENDMSDWNVWINATVGSDGMFGENIPTSIPQKPEDLASPIFVPPSSKRAFYVSFDGPYLRFTRDVARRFYQNADMIIYGAGSSKRAGWDGRSSSQRTFNGGVHYYVTPSSEGSQQSDPLPDGVGLLPHGVIVSEEPTTSPTVSPTVSPTTSPTTGEPTLSPTTSEPTLSQSPSASLVPTFRPTESPTGSPTKRPTDLPTGSPISVELLATEMADSTEKPVQVYAGYMFDVRAREDIEISTMAVNTYHTTPIDVQLYYREGTFVDAIDDITKWEWRANVTVDGMGMGNPSYLPMGSFEPIIMRKGESIGVYMTSDGPYLRATKGTQVGKPLEYNSDIVVFEGAGKRYPINKPTITPRKFNGVIGYKVIDIPSPSPTIDTAGLFVRNATVVPSADTYIQKQTHSSVNFGKKAQIMVDGSPERVSLIKFDVGMLNLNTENAPDQILSATLRLYSMTGSDYGGMVTVIPDGDFNEHTVTWDNSPYAINETGTILGEFRSVWPNKFYEMDVTRIFRDAEAGNVPTSFVVRISSHISNGVLYRARDGASDKGPRLTVAFAYDPSENKALARVFGSDPPTNTPTMKPTTPEWENPKTLEDPPRTYFNYNPRSRYGPENWDRPYPDGYYDRLRRLKTNVWRNKCMDGRRQSPRDLCQTNAECLEFHETRPRKGEYGLGARNETIARPTPTIEHNKLRLTYNERRSEREKPIPPGADFARNGFKSGIQDLVNIDIKIRSEHRLCGKQYDAEMQQFYLHQYGNLEAISILINADGTEDNAHWQILLDYFQDKFDRDERSCARKQQRARALFNNKRRANDVGEGESKLRGRISTNNNDGIDSEVDMEGYKNDGSEASSSLSFGSIIYDRLLRFVQRRQKKELRWNVLEPWHIYKSVHFWAYSGSITEPPCFEDVKWRVTDVPMTISPVQYIQMKKLLFDHVDPVSCRKTSTHHDESNARPVQPYRGGATYRCRRSDYASDVERRASGRVKGFVLEPNWWGVNDLPYVTPEFPNVG